MLLDELQEGDAAQFFLTADEGDPRLAGTTAVLLGDDGEQWVAGHGERDDERIGARLALAGVDELGIGAHDVLHCALDGIVDLHEHRGALTPRKRR